jgi:hypothetical protein
MPKKRSAKDIARYYTTAQKTRLPPPSEPEESLKDVTTQLHELRIEHARELQFSRAKMAPDSCIDKPMPLGFAPANYTVESSLPQPARRIPGPAPPLSWIQLPRRGLRRTSIPMIVHARTDPVPPFPGLEYPNPRSLVHHSLISMGTHFYDHQVVNKYHLPELTVQMKQWLLTYIACRHIDGGITKEGLDVLFPWKKKKTDPEEMADIIRLSKKDEVDVRYLDLADFLTGDEDEIVYQLQSFLTPWHVLDTTMENEIHDLFRFPNLTHLSLDISSIRSPKFSRYKLVRVLCEKLPRLTHLSLAGVFASATSSSALIYLSRNLLCLEYIDLSRNMSLHERYGNPYMTAWEDTAEPYIAETGRLLDRLSWEGGWRTVKTLVIKKCGFTKDMENEIRGRIVRKRRRGWIKVITS